MRAILRIFGGLVLAFQLAPAAASYGQEQGFPSSAPGVLQTTDGIMLAIQSGGGRKPLWYYNGRYGVQGSPGERFSVYLYNPGPGMRKFVVTLDGINIIDGSPGSLSGKGYILRPGEAETIRGWRDGRYYREFVFNWKGRDVATLLGQAGNQGTLGLAVWDGQITRGPMIAEAPVPDRYESAETAPMRAEAPAAREPAYGAAPGAPLPSPNDLGVDQGGRVLSPVRQVTFQPTALVAEMSLFYATNNALQRVGASRVRPGGGYIPAPQPYESARPPVDVRPYVPSPPSRPAPQPWGGNPFPQDAPSVFRD